MKILGVCFLVGAAACSAGATEIKEFPAAGLKSLYAVAENGSLRVSGGQVNAVSVEISDNDPAKCAVTTKVEGGVLRLAAESLPAPAERSWRNLFGLVQHGSDRTECKASFRVTAPGSLPLELHNGLGGVEADSFRSDVAIYGGLGGVAISGLTGNLKIEDGMGKVSGSACAKSLKLKTDMGGVQLTGLCGPVDADKGMGNLDLEWVRAPASGEANISGGMGSVRLAFPANAKLDVSLTSDMGKTVNEFSNQGGFKVRGKLGMGEVSVVKAENKSAAVRE